MRALGFDTAPVAESTEGRRRFERQQRREVLLVLELAGPAWQQALEWARENAARHEAAAQANADSKEFAARPSARGSNSRPRKSRTAACSPSTPGWTSPRCGRSTRIAAAS
jgi:hypothetical protein